MRKNNCTPNCHKDKEIQVIISARGILTITHYTNQTKNCHLTLKFTKNYMFKLFTVLLIYKTLIPIPW